VADCGMFQATVLPPPVLLVVVGRGRRCIGVAAGWRVDAGSAVAGVQFLPVWLLLKFNSTTAPLIARQLKR